MTYEEAHALAARSSQTTTLESETVRVGGVLFAPGSQPLAAARRHVLPGDVAATGCFGDMCRNLLRFDAECD